MEESNNDKGHVISQCQDAVMTIEFHHPAHNSLPAHLLDELVATLDRASEDPEVNVVVLRSRGDRTFLSLIHI